MQILKRGASSASPAKREKKKRRQSGSRRVSFADNLAAVREFERDTGFVASSDAVVSSPSKKRALTDLSSNAPTETQQQQQQQAGEDHQPADANRGGVLKRSRRFSLQPAPPSSRRMSLAAPESDAVRQLVGNDAQTTAQYMSHRRYSDAGAAAGYDASFNSSAARSSENDGIQWQGQATSDATPTSEMPDFTQLLADDADQMGSSYPIRETETATRPTAEVPDMNTLLRDDEADESCRDTSAPRRPSNLEQLGLLNLTEEDGELTTSFTVNKTEEHCAAVGEGRQTETSGDHRRQSKSGLQEHESNLCFSLQSTPEQQNAESGESRNAIDEQVPNEESGSNAGAEETMSSKKDVPEEQNATPRRPSMQSYEQEDQPHADQREVVSISGLAQEARDSFDQKLSDVGGLNEMRQWAGMVTPEQQLQRRADLHRAHGAEASDEPEAYTPASVAHYGRANTSPDSAAPAEAPVATPSPTNRNAFASYQQEGVVSDEGMDKAATYEQSGLTPGLDQLQICSGEPYEAYAQPPEADKKHTDKRLDTDANHQSEELDVTQIGREELGTSTYNFVYGKSGSTASLMNQQRFSYGAAQENEDDDSRNNSMSPGIARQSVIEEELRKGARPSIAEVPSSGPTPHEQEFDAPVDEEPQCSDTLESNSGAVDGSRYVNCTVAARCDTEGDGETGASAAPLSRRVSFVPDEREYVPGGANEEARIWEAGSARPQSNENQEDEEHLPDTVYNRAGIFPHAEEAHDAEIQPAQEENAFDIQDNEEDHVGDHQSNDIVTEYDHNTEHFTAENNSSVVDFSQAHSKCEGPPNETAYGGHCENGNDVQTATPLKRVSEGFAQTEEDSSEIMAVTPLSDDKEPTWIAQASGSARRLSEQDDAATGRNCVSSSIKSNAREVSQSVNEKTAQKDVDAADERAQISTSAAHAANQGRQSQQDLEPSAEHYQQAVSQQSIGETGIMSHSEHEQASEGNVSGLHKETLDHFASDMPRQPPPRRQSAVTEALHQRMQESVEGTSKHDDISPEEKHKSPRQHLEQTDCGTGEGPEIAIQEHNHHQEQQHQQRSGKIDSMPMSLQSFMDAAEVNFLHDASLLQRRSSIGMQSESVEQAPSTDEEKLTLRAITCEETAALDELVTHLRNENSNAKERVQALKDQVENNPPELAKALACGSLDTHDRESVKNSFKALKSLCKYTAREQFCQKRSELESHLSSKLETWHAELKRVDDDLNAMNIDDVQHKMSSLEYELEQEADRQAQLSRRRWELEEERKGLQAQQQKADARLQAEQSRKEAIASRRQAVHADSQQLKPRLQDAREAASSAPEQAEALKRFFQTKANASRAIENASLLRSVCSLSSFPDKQSTPMMLCAINGFTITVSSDEVSLQQPRSDDCFFTGDVLALSSYLSSLPMRIPLQSAHSSADAVQLGIVAAGRASDLAEEAQRCLRRGLLSSIAFDEAGAECDEVNSVAILRFAEHNQGRVVSIGLQKQWNTSTASLNLTSSSRLSVREVCLRSAAHSQEEKERIEAGLWHAIREMKKGIMQLERLCEVVHNAMTCI